MLVATKRTTSVGALSWPAALIVWGPGDASTSHTHHCVQLIFALSGMVRVRQRPGTPWLQCGAVIIAPDAQHEVEARGRSVLIGFIDPESALAATLLNRLSSKIVRVPMRTVTRWRAALADVATLEEERVARWLRSELLHQKTPKAMHPRVRRVLRALRQDPLDPKRTSLRRLAQLAGLSPSRFMHVFTESLGIPLRPYLLWLRVQRAAGAIAAGRSVTEAAYAAGFADSAHLTRTFRRMLGTTPRELRSRAAATRELQLES